MGRANESVPTGYRMIAAEHGIPQSVLFAVALTESGKQTGQTGTLRPWPWTLNVAGRGYFFDSRQAAWQAIAARHTAETAFNLLYRPGCMYLVPRATQGHYVHSAWTAGFAWSEVSGSLVVTDQQAFDELAADVVEAEFRRLALRP